MKCSHGRKKPLYLCHIYFPCLIISYETLILRSAKGHTCLGWLNTGRPNILQNPELFGYLHTAYPFRAITWHPGKATLIDGVLCLPRVSTRCAIFIPSKPTSLFFSVSQDRLHSKVGWGWAAVFFILTASKISFCDEPRVHTVP